MKQISMNLEKRIRKGKIKSLFKHQIKQEKIEDKIYVQKECKGEEERRKEENRQTRIHGCEHMR